MKPVQLVPLTVNIGGQLADHEIIGREATVKLMFEYLDRGMNLSINDPRRIGKSAALQLLEAASTDKTKVVLTSVQPVKTIDGFFYHLASVLHGHQSLGRRLRKGVTNLVESARVMTEVDGVPFAVGVRGRHQHKTKRELLMEMVSAIDDALGEGELLVLAVDEFTEAILNIARNPDAGSGDATQLLQTLQMLRKDCPAVRWILTGSIGMHHAIRWTDCTSSVVSGDCKNVPVGALSLAHADYLSRCLALGEDIALVDEAHVALIEAVDGIPILIHAIIEDLRKQPARDAFDQSDVEAAIDRYIHDQDESRAFEHFVSRLATYYFDDELPIARALLDRSAGRKKPYKVDKLVAHAAEACGATTEVVRTVLGMVVDDHYLITEEGRARWRYPILARVWRTKRNLG